MEEWYRHIKDEDWLIAPASNGFITDEIVYEWLQHFDAYTDDRGNWRLLLIDNYETYCIIKFFQYYKA
jgi:hypothetical protein